MPPKKQKKKDHADAYEKKVRMKGKTKFAGESMGTGSQEPSSDSGDPDLDIDRSMTIKPKHLHFQKTAASSRQIGLTKPKAMKSP